MGESQEQTGEPHAHCRRRRAGAHGAGPGRLEVDAAQVFAGFSRESGARATTLFTGAERYEPGAAYQRGGLASCFSRCRFTMLGVQEGKEGKGREGKGREANGEIAGYMQNTQHMQ